MRTRHVVLLDDSESIPYPDLSALVAALQTQVDRDFAPIWGVRAQLSALAAGDPPPIHASPIRFVSALPPGEGGIHLDKRRTPYALVAAGNDWTVSASHELVEMLVDPLGHKFVRAPDIDPSSDGHNVSYLVEVGDPCEVFAYQINGIAVSDFVTPEFYDDQAPAGTAFDFLGRLTRPFDVPAGCYLSWIDPGDGRWHQKQADGSFVAARTEITPKRNPRDDRDAAFAEAKNRHNLQAILARHAASRKR